MHVQDIFGTKIIKKIFCFSIRKSNQLPDKTIASLVKYYYSWKKTRSRTSVMDRQEKIKIKDGSENGSENGSNEDSDNEDKVSYTLYSKISFEKYIVCKNLNFPKISLNV